MYGTIDTRVRISVRFRFGLMVTECRNVNFRSFATSYGDYISQTKYTNTLQCPVNEKKNFKNLNT